MGIFDKILGNWVKIVDIFSNVTIEDFEYRTGVLSELVENHCTKCVAVNHCWFKNEKGKKPESFDYSNIKLIDAMMKGLIPGLYHYKCHCKEKPIIVSSLSEIELIYSNDKIMYLFKDKGAWIESMGFHTEEDYDYFVETLLEKTKEAYYYGKYEIQDITKYGCKANFFIDMPGLNEKNGKIYKLKANYMIFPDGKLKMNTPIGGWQK